VVFNVIPSVRSTNVYEEQSLGIYNEGDSDEEEPDFPAGEGKRMTVWSRYLAMHVRKQLAFGTIAPYLVVEILLTMV
jgi:hypothetical protein